MTVVNDRKKCHCKYLVGRICMNLISSNIDVYITSYYEKVEKFGSLQICFFFVKSLFLLIRCRRLRIRPSSHFVDGFKTQQIKCENSYTVAVFDFSVFIVFRWRGSEENVPKVTKKDISVKSAWSHGISAVGVNMSCLPPRSSVLSCTPGNVWDRPTYAVVTYRNTATSLCS